MSRQALPADTILGSGLDQYRIESVLGVGGFGITYLARSIGLERLVAIKEYFPADFATRVGETEVRALNTGGRNFFEDGKRYFVEEARVLGRFRHEHIVRLIGLVEQFGTAYMVLEFEEGMNLKRWWQRLERAPTQAEIDAILGPILSALEAIHEQRLFHRDIAPDNIIVRADGRPVLIDFGAARQFARENSHTLGAIVKSGYSPPEQYTLDTKLQGAWSDVYALAATLYQAITGRPPVDAARRQLQDDAIPIERHIPPETAARYRPGFLAAINEGLALRPRERPQSIAEWRRQLMPARAVESLDRRSGQVPSRSGTLFQGPAAETRVASGLTRAPHSNTPSARSAAVAAGPPAFSGTEGRPGIEPALQLVALAAAAIGAVVFFWLGGINHGGGWMSALTFFTGVPLFLALVLVQHGRQRSDLAAGDRGGEPANSAAAGAFALAAFWLPPFFLPTYYLAAILGVVAALALLAPRSRWPAVVLAAASIGHLSLAGWLLLAQPLGNSGFVFLLAGGLMVVAGLALAAASQWIGWTREVARSEAQ